MVHRHMMIGEQLHFLTKNSPRYLKITHSHYLFLEVFQIGFLPWNGNFTLDFSLSK